MTTDGNDFLDSLDLDDAAILPFIPQILNGLWELGSIAEYAIDLVEKNIPKKELTNAIDLGCGKGAVLIQMSEKRKFEGIGIDLMESFILAAKNYARQWPYSKHLTFETADIKQVINTKGQFDLVIYAHDSDLFGDLTQTLPELEKCLAPNGHILLESMHTLEKNKDADYPDKTEFYAQIDDSEFEMVDQIIWDIQLFKSINQQNMILIEGQIEQLIKDYPEKEQLFRNYLTNQYEECEELENELQCVTMLLKRKSAK